ncbi:DKNYY domain-containing protein [Paraburkholderia flava]|uniref:DKNYY domain-containing protein n=1 Tax=Paraburkholderia flava TaxID=2547393 RepID=UPI00105DFD88|nr:DKNYY domain-containing protein [Paraburkholderia flava]
MKIPRLRTLIIGVLLLAIASGLIAFLGSVFSSDGGYQSAGYRDASGQYEVGICHETRHGKFTQPGQVTWTQGKTQTCAANTRFLSKNYVVQKDLVYWMTSYSYMDILSRGSPEVQREDRDLTLMTTLTPAFHRIPNDGVASHEDWQRDQFEYFAADDSSVYFENKKIEGADPKDFSLVFPFKEEQWRNFHFSRSRGKLFVNGEPMPEIDFAHFELLKFVSQPGRGIDYGFDATLTIDPNSGSFGMNGMLARTGNDLVYLRLDGAAVFKDMAPPDAFTFIEPKHMYFSRGDQFYEVGWDEDEHTGRIAGVDADTINRRYKAELDAPSDGRGN